MNECATNVPFAILAVARHLEATNNSGTRFAGGVMHQYRWIRKAKYKYFRDGILYYSRGHGWRVRKKPHWKAVFNLRFNQWFDEAGFPVEVDADAPLGVPTKAAGAD